MPTCKNGVCNISKRPTKKISGSKMPVKAITQNSAATNTNADKIRNVQRVIADQGSGTQNKGKKKSWGQSFIDVLRGKRDPKTGGSAWAGHDASIIQAPTLNAQQQGILQYLLQHAQQQQENPYGGFEDIQNDVNQNFQQQILPSILERFSSMGNNSLSSPSLGNQIGQTAANTNQGLGALRAQYGQQNKQNALQQFGMGLTQPFENFYQPESSGIHEGITKGLIGGVGSLFKSWIGA